MVNSKNENSHIKRIKKEIRAKDEKTPKSGAYGLCSILESNDRSSARNKLTLKHTGSCPEFRNDVSISLSPPPFDWTLRCWVCVCCFVLLYFGYYVVLCVKKKKKIVDNKKKKWRINDSMWINGFSLSMTSMFVVNRCVFQRLSY